MFVLMDNYNTFPYLILQRNSIVRKQFILLFYKIRPNLKTKSPSLDIYCFIQQVWTQKCTVLKASVDVNISYY